MNTEQIYSLVNETALQALGNNAIAVIDTSTLVSLGNTILSSQQNTEAFLDTLCQRIGRTIMSFRAYRNKLNDMVLNDFEYGAILQKIKISMPTAEADESFDLVDGTSVDHYKIAKPKANQKLFVTRTPYQFHVTVQRVLLKEAFLSESGLASFISGVFGEMQNAIELALENLGRACLANFIAETTHEIKLVTEYNAAKGTVLTAATAMYNEDFLRFALARIKGVSKRLTDMSTEWNDGTETRFTPFEEQRIRVISDFQTNLETQVQYAAFNERFVELTGYKELNFWQAEQTPMSISVKRASDQTEVTIENAVAVLYDRDALGIYKVEEDVLTTPVNAAARYYNTYFHEQQLWFNDLSENFILFTLN